MEHNTAAVCGIWWHADVCIDGTPQGYGVYEVDENQVKWYYKSAGHPKDYQFRSYAAGTSKEFPKDIIANVLSLIHISITVPKHWVVKMQMEQVT